MKDIVVFYHGNCSTSDGFGGAYAAWKKFGAKADYIPMWHQKPLPVIPRDKQVYFIDIVPSERDLTKLQKTNRRVTAIDHHISAEYLVKRTENYSYALNHSGAVLAWEYFWGDKKIPRLLLNIEDVDLYKFKLAYTREVCAILEMLPHDFKVWDKFVKRIDNSGERKQAIAEGTLLLRYKNALIENIIQDTARPVLFQGVKTYAVNSPMFETEIGNWLYPKHPPMAIIWYERNDKRKFSLRSAKNFDVEKLAAKYGGGGHKRSAGFVMSLNKPLPWKEL